MATLDRAYVLAPFHKLLANCQSNVFMGLRLVEKMDTFPEPTPEELKFMNLSFGRHAPQFEEDKIAFKRWILLNGFGDIYKALRATLERFFVFKTIEQRLPTNHTLNLRESKTELHLKARGFHLPQLFSVVPSLCGEPLELRTCVESFNHARNCLEHEQGVVTAKRCNNPAKDKFLLQGRRFKMFFKDGEKKILAEFGKPGPENSALMLGAEDFKIEFALNQPIELSLRQFIDILNTCIFIRADIDLKLAKIP